MNEEEKTHNEIIKKLKNVLGTFNCDHKVEIMKQSSLKRAHIYCKIYNLSGQLSGTLIENYIKKNYEMSKNNVSLCNGDLNCNQTNFEIKISNGGKNHNKFNYVQLRMNHDCEYIFTAYYINDENIKIEGELFVFKLKKKDLIKIISKYGGYAHGTVSKLGKITVDDLEDIQNNKEYAIRPKYGDNCWNQLLNFRVNEL